MRYRSIALPLAAASAEPIPDRRFHIVRSAQKLLDERRFLMEFQGFVETDLP
jgi:hypothetical protein